MQRACDAHSTHRPFYKQGLGGRQQKMPAAYFLSINKQKKKTSSLYYMSEKYRIFNQLNNYTVIFRFLAAARSRSGENNAQCCFLTPSRRFATLYERAYLSNQGGKIYALGERRITTRYE